MTDKKVREGQHDGVYGSSFALYDRKALLEFLEPFRVRFQANSLSPRDFFAGRRCLDAGCGNGRGSLFMLENGAAHVTAVDLSGQNIESTRKNLSDLGYANFECHHTTLESLPFPTASFDFVWCNGVIMHTASPDDCIAELARVLKPSGGLWLYVYGSGGIYWYFVRRFRAMLAHVPVDRLIKTLQLLNYPVRFIAEYADDWKTPFLRAYADTKVQRKLSELGFEQIRRVSKGMPYDTSARILERPEERTALGEGDLRYLAVRGATVNASSESLNVNHIDDQLEPDVYAVNTFGAGLDELASLVRDQDLAAIAACARLQYYLRENVMSTSARMDVSAMSGYLTETIALLKSVARLNSRPGP
jgi:ubiquinone/menaquinone biosynthesis C-methylase UbiE